MMTHEEDQALRYASQEDRDLFSRATEGLPAIYELGHRLVDADGIPYPASLDAHSVRCLREIVEMINPKHMLCIGTNVGYSDSLWLSLAPDLKIISCDISKKAETKDAVRALYAKYRKRFFYIDRHSNLFPEMIQVEKFDSCFIDGSHYMLDVAKDIELCLSLGIPHIIFDDYLEDFGEVQKAIEWFKERLELVNINGNIALYKTIL